MLNGRSDGLPVVLRAGHISSPGFASRVEAVLTLRRAPTRRALVALKQVELQRRPSARTLLIVETASVCATGQPWIAKLQVVVLPSTDDADFVAPARLGKGDEAAAGAWVAGSHSVHRRYERLTTLCHCAENQWAFISVSISVLSDTTADGSTASMPQR